MYESEGVVAEREVRTKVHGLLQLTDRFVVAALEPKCPSHRPMRSGIVMSGAVHAVFAIRYSLSPFIDALLSHVWVRRLGRPRHPKGAGSPVPMFCAVT
jgi:hypothetical protein